MRDVVSTSQGRIIFCVFVRVFILVFLVSFIKIDIAHADGNVIDKVYHPYVDAMEKELEFRSLFQNLPVTNLLPVQVHQLSLGSAWGNSFFGEAKLVGSKTQQKGFELSAFEFELKWQLTEQGEYSADWGVVFEIEHGVERDLDELSVGLLIEKEFGRWSTTANLFAIQEWGDSIEGEFETVFGLQARYRHARLFEPALEFYLGQNTVGIGPVLIGSANVGARKSLSWEVGVIAGLSNKSPNSTYRVLLEYEF
jgi:hypothetical protein